MKHGSLFSGIGGFDLAAEWMGWENVFHCEWNPFGQKILKHYWPKAINYNDITKTDFTKHRGTIDILTGGFPCQPYSLAGKQLGKEDDRHLWPEMLRAIREIQPKWIVGENVSGIVSWGGGLVFEEVQTDLENEGYEVQAIILPACSINAPHRRDRVWFVAYSNKCAKGSPGKSRKIEIDRSKNDDEQNCGRKQTQQHIGHGYVFGDVANSDSSRLQKNGAEQQAARFEQYGKLGRPIYAKGNATNSNGRRQSIEKYRQKKSRRFTKTSISDNWSNFPTQSPVCNGNDGISARLDITAISYSKWRNESIKGGGNAIVPQVALQIFKAIQEYEMKNI